MNMSNEDLVGMILGVKMQYGDKRFYNEKEGTIDNGAAIKEVQQELLNRLSLADKFKWQMCADVELDERMSIIGAEPIDSSGENWAIYACEWIDDGYHTAYPDDTPVNPTHFMLLPSQPEDKGE